MRSGYSDSGRTPVSSRKKRQTEKRQLEKIVRSAHQCLHAFVKVLHLHFLFVSQVLEDGLNFVVCVPELLIGVRIDLRRRSRTVLGYGQEVSATRNTEVRVYVRNNVCVCVC